VPKRNSSVREHRCGSDRIWLGSVLQHSLCSSKRDRKVYHDLNIGIDAASRGIRQLPEKRPDLVSVILWSLLY
jgi:hypothetical protein